MMNVADPRAYQAATRLPPAVTGLAPVALSLAVGAALTWGSGAHLWRTVPESGVRAVSAWVGLAALALIVTVPLAALATEVLAGPASGRSDRTPRLVRRFAIRSQERKYGRAVARYAGQEALYLDELADVIAEVLAENVAGRSPAPESEIRSLIRRLMPRYRRDRPVRDEKTGRTIVHDVIAELSISSPDLLRGADVDRAEQLIQSRVAATLRPPGVALAYPRPAALEPTRLRNADAAVADRLRRRYGMDLGTTMPRLIAVLPGTDRDTLFRASRRVQVAVSLSVGWLLGGLWLFVALSGTAAEWRPPALGAIVAVLSLGGTSALAVTSYGEAVTRTILLGQAVESAVDLHRLELLDALHWRRPRDPQEERALFAAMAANYQDGVDAERFRRWDEPDPAGTAAPTTVNQYFAQAMQDLPVQLTESVRDGLRQGLRQDLAPAVERTLRSSLRGPVLDNYDGHLSVALLDNLGTVVPLADGAASVLWNKRYDLSVVLGPDAMADHLTAPLRLRGGADAETVRFDVAVESNVPALRQRSRSVNAPADRPIELRFPLDLPTPGSEAPWVWVQVSQRGRTLQSLEIRLHGPGPAA